MSLADLFVKSLPLVMDVAGNYVKAKQRKKLIKAQDVATSGFLDQQSALTAGNAPVVANTIQQFTPEAQQAALGAAAGRRTAAYSGDVPQFMQDAPMRDSVGGPTRAALARGVVDAIDRSRQNAAALAQLGAHQDVRASNAIAINSAGRQLGTTADFARGNQGVYNLKLNAASTPPEGLFSDASISDLLRGGSQLTNIFLASRLRKAPVQHGPTNAPIPGAAR